jgi:parallel beta-helix repeat protein
LKTLITTVALIALLISIGQALQIAEAQPSTFTINPDGTITPSTGLLQRRGNLYTLEADLNCSIYIQKGDIVVDGANHTLNGPGSSQNYVAITIMAGNVTLRNFRISGWKAGIYGAFNNNTVTSNVLTNNYQGISIYASDFTASENRISQSSTAILICSGTQKPQGDNNLILRNEITDNNWAIDILNSNGTTITENNVANNSVILTLGTLKSNLSLAGFHMLYLNNFKDNGKALHIPFGGPTVAGFEPISPAGNWDNGSVGNYWSDYSSVFPNATEIDHLGIADTPYLINHSITWSRDYANGTHLEGTAVLGMGVDHYPLTTPRSPSARATPAPPLPSPTKTATHTLDPANSSVLLPSSSTMPTSPTQTPRSTWQQEPSPSFAPQGPGDVQYLLIAFTAAASVAVIVTIVISRAKKSGSQTQPVRLHGGN